METENVIAEVVFDFNPTDDIELTLKKGDIITIRRSAGNGWLEGERDGKIGLFPGSYIKKMEPSNANDTPVSAKKPLIDHMLALDQKSAYNPEKAAEIFVENQRASIIAGPQWKHMNKPMGIEVRDPQTESRFNGMKQYTVYVVETKALEAIVSRRYKHFLWLYDRLADMFPCLSLPPMPVKQFSGNLDPQFVYNRRRGLERFLNRCACHPVFAHSKIFHDFLTCKDEKEWKIGSKSKTKKLFSPTIYSAIEYPQHNVPHSELVYVEKFSQFTRLLEANMFPVQQTCQKQGEAYGSIALSMAELGCNLQKLAKGTQLFDTTRNSASLSRKGSVQATSMSAVHKQIRSAAELEEGTEEPNYNWGWKDSAGFTTLMSDLQEIGSEICKIAESFNFQQGIVGQTLSDLITDYNGIILTIPGIVKLHQEAMEIYENSKKTDSKKNAEAMKMNCEALHNIVLAEFDYLHRILISDFRYMVSLYLRKQADFHLQLAERYEMLYQSFSHMDTKFGCHPPMSTNGDDVEESVSDGDDEMQKKTPYCNFFPKSSYQNIQFKQMKDGNIEPRLVNDVSASTDKTNEDEVVSTQPINSSPSVEQSPKNSVTTPSITISTTGTTTATVTGQISSVTGQIFSVPMSSSSNDSLPAAGTSKTTITLVEIHPRVSLELAGQVVPSTAHSSTSQSSATTTSGFASMSSDSNDGPISSSDDPDNSSTKVNSAVIEIGDINPVYQSWVLKKKTESKPVPVVPANQEVPNSSGTKGTSAYDLMEPILKPSTHNSSVFLSAPSSLTDNQTSEGAQPSVSLPLMYENVVPVKDGKFTVTPPSSCDSKENLDFTLEPSPTEQQTSLKRSNSTGSLLPRPAIQNNVTFYSPANNRKEILKHSVSLSAGPQVVAMQPISKSLNQSEIDAKNDSKINIRGSTAISRGSVKKKINLFETSTLPAGSKSLAELGILEDQDSDNGFIV